MFCKLLITDKDLETPMHPLQILFVRMVITYSFCIIYFVWWEKNPDFPFGPKGYRLLLLLRAVGGFVGVGGQYWSLLYLNVSDTVCITFLAPTVTSFMAYIFLNERFTRVEAIGGLFAFFGVILIAKPHFLLNILSLSDNAPFDSSDSATGRIIGTTFAFMSTFGTGTAMCSIRKIGFNTHPLFMVSIYALFTTVASFLGILILPGLSFQIPHTVKQWSLLIIIGVAGFFMQLLLTAGMQREKAARAIAMTYTQLIYASIFDFFVNGKIPQGWSLIGEIIIVLAVFSIVYFKDSNSITNVNNNNEMIDLERDVELNPYKDNVILRHSDDDSDFKVDDSDVEETQNQTSPSSSSAFLKPVTEGFTK
jgi:drug/metabolite transporter (DMT)-like permease